MSVEDSWAHGSSYEAYMGRWSRRVASRFVDGLGVGAGSTWLDVGCGTGALAAEILSTRAPESVSGVDQSAGFIAAAATMHPDIDLRVADARALPFDDDTFDATVSGIAINFVPEPSAAVREMKRVTNAGGTVAIYLWDYADGMQMIRRFWDVAIALDPDARDLDEALRFPLCRAEPMAELFNEAGLDPRSTSIEIPTRFATFDDFWQPFLAGQGPAPSYVGSLDDDARAALRDRLAAELVDSRTGEVDLSARAWVTAATV